MPPSTGLTTTVPSGDGTHGEAAAGSGLAIDLRRLPWITRLAADYAFDYARLDDFFAGNPAEPQAWRTVVDRAARHPRDRQALVDVLRAQQQRRGAPAESIAAAGSLGDARGVAILTGQQAGLFGGPLFTLLKALTAVQLAERVRAEQHVPAVAVFWVDAEDHDWDEVKACAVLDHEGALVPVSVGNPPGAGVGSVARVHLDEAAATALHDLGLALPPTEFTEALLEDLGRIYRPGAGMADAFARWLERLLGPRGLVVFDASDPAAKPLVADLFAREVERAGQTAQLVQRAGAELAALGYHAQVTPQPDSLALFHLAERREPIRIVGDGYMVGDRLESRSQLVDRVRATPAAFSPNVLLRPLVQDTLFPTACYVAGPSELAYLGQLRRVYDLFGVPMPLIYQRGSATILDGNGMRFLSRQNVPFADLRARDDAALNQLLASQLPASVEAALQDAARAMADGMARLAAEVPRIDATLEGATRSTLGRMQDELRKLQNKVVQAAKRKDDTLRRQFQHAQVQAFPGGHPQERMVGFVYFLNKYGPAFIDRLNDAVPLDIGHHRVITI